MGIGPGKGERREKSAARGMKCRDALSGDFGKINKNQCVDECSGFGTRLEDIFGNDIRSNISPQLAA
jgi:hypothetical protein